MIWCRNEAINLDLELVSLGAHWIGETEFHHCGDLKLLQATSLIQSMALFLKDFQGISQANVLGNSSTHNDSLFSMSWVLLEVEHHFT